MSNEQAPVLNIFDFLNTSLKEAFQSMISDAFVADYGIVQAVHLPTVDVVHAVLSVTRPGLNAPATPLPAIQTYGAEVLWPSMAGLSITGTIKKGDPVLLIGLRDVVPSTQGITQPSQPPEFWHYAQQTLKAIPLSGVTTASVQFGELNGKAFLRTAAASLFTILNTLISDLQTFASAAGTATTAAQIAAAAATLATALPAVTTQLGQLLEA